MFVQDANNYSYVHLELFNKRMDIFHVSALLFPFFHSLNEFQDVHLKWPNLFAFFGFN